MQFPVHVGPYLKDSTITSDKILLKYMKIDDNSPLYVFDIMLEETEYEERLVNVRQLCNSNGNRAQLTDLPMVKANSFQEFVAEQKRHLENGEQGVIYYTSHSLIRRPSIIKFKKEESKVSE